jgi:hypothetical protein
MINLEFCKQRLLEAAEFETVGGVRPQVTALTRRLLKVRLTTAKDRAALRLWAETVEALDLALAALVCAVVGVFVTGLVAPGIRGCGASALVTPRAAFPIRPRGTGLF